MDRRHSECRRTAKAQFYSRAVFLAVFIAGFVFLFDVARSAEIDDAPLELANSILTSSEIYARKEHSADSGTAVESFSRDFGYPVRTRLEIISGAAKWHDDDDDDDFDSRPLLLLRFRRADNEPAVTQDGSSILDYMSSYYAQRKAIMDKYNSQQREISERLEKTKSSIAAKQRLKESKTKLNQPEIENATRATQDRNVFPPSVTPPYAESELTTTESSPNSTSFENEIVENNSSDRRYEATNSYSQTLNATVITPIPEGRSPADAHFNETSDFMPLMENSTQHSPPPNVSFPYVYTTLIPTFENNNDDVENDDDENPEVNFPPQEEVNLNILTEESPAIMGPGRSRDNETLIIDLGGRLTDNPWRNDSASAELDKMFLWDVEAAEERLQRSNGTTDSRGAENPLENDGNSIVFDDLHPSSSPLNGTSVSVESSPGVQVTKNVTNLQSSTTMYRNLTHEIIEVDGVVTEVRRIDETEVVGRQAGAGNWTNGNGNASVLSGEVYGGARESEWCEECPHDYRWGECEGTLFYQHNIFLRNRGPSAIDAIFGMEVQGPVDVTCVEALRFNQTRGIVTLHSGGPGNDFAKLRIRGFQGEGFSYIMKVWGVNNEDRHTF